MPTFWPPKYSLGLPLNASLCSTDVFGTKAPASTRDDRPPPWVKYSRNVKAASLCSAAAGMPKELPPFSAPTLAPRVHCGIGATLKSPAAFGARSGSVEVSQPPMVWVARVPSLSARFQSSDQPVILVFSRSSSSIFCQKATALLVPSSVKSMRTLLPSTVNG